MGMFDYVEYEMKCPVCGELVNGFQSKDGSCSLGTLTPFDVDNFYDSCRKCGAWIEFSRKTPKPGNVEKDFEMFLRKPTVPNKKISNAQEIKKV